jgi:histidinol dehydrogenase
MKLRDVSKLTPKEREHIIKRGPRIDTDGIREIINEVKTKGDAALKKFTKKFDGVDLESFKVSDEEFGEAQKKANLSVVEKISIAHKNILSYHKKQAEKDSWYEEEGKRLGQIIRPVESVGCYVPGGKAFYPSSVLMTAIPAKVAGVERIVCATPPRDDDKINEHTLVACKIAGVDEVYKIGGAQAIAALTYGTESIPKVDMIVGPGNVFVTAAKRAVFGDVGIDMLAGPSEILIIADSTGNADLIATDILAQAEHDPRASCVLVTTDIKLATDVKSSLDKISMAPDSLSNTSILIAKDLIEATKFSNEYAPEHLEIIVEDEQTVLEMIKNAGSIFLGTFSPVAAGDYASGPNHVLPTGGCARFQSGLNVGDFLKKISVQKLSKKGLEKIGDVVIVLSKAEGLKYHSDSVKKRL